MKVKSRRVAKLGVPPARCSVVVGGAPPSQARRGNSSRGMHGRSLSRPELVGAQTRSIPTADRQKATISRAKLVIAGAQPSQRHRAPGAGPGAGRERARPGPTTTSQDSASVRRDAWAGSVRERLRARRGGGNSAVVCAVGGQGQPRRSARSWSCTMRGGQRGAAPRCTWLLKFARTKGSYGGPKALTIRQPFAFGI